jgi:outer membrane protein assembly factor BamA
MTRIPFVQLVAVTLTCALGATRLGAQETVAAATNAELASAQSPSTARAERGPLERSVEWATSKIDAFGGGKDGVYPALGNMVPGSGWLRAGAGYRRHVFGDTAIVGTSATVSAQRYVVLQSGIEWPRLLSDRLSVSGQAKYQDFTGVNYFGVGAGTTEDAETNYRLRDIDVLGGATFRPREALSIGGHVGYLRGPAVGDGKSSLSPSTLERFDESTAPGLLSAIRYAHADGFIEADTRDVPGYPASGGVYRLGVSAFRDLEGSGHSFHMVDLDAAQYLPVFHKNWTIAVRSRVTMTQTAAGDEVPFFLMPTLGGGNTLRGYADYRFRDRNAALVSAEYQWPLFRMMDAALFLDAGSVAGAPSDLLRAHLNRDYGLGLRLHSTTTSIARIDVARSPEGMRFILSFSQPLHASRRTVAPYVP